MRKFLLKQISECKMNEAVMLCQKGLVSLAEAATMPGVSLYKMME
jgi:predicted HTH domain antitoxin